MANRIKPFLHSNSPSIWGYSFYCLGCKGHHHVTVETPGPTWEFNGNLEYPSFMPSILLTWTKPVNMHDEEALQADLKEVDRRRAAGEADVRLPTVNKVCHSYVANGMIQYLSDCTHSLAGQTVELPPIVNS